MSKTRHVFVRSYGCQMNVYDSGRMLDAMKSSGYRETRDQGAADLIVLNTCHIREKATEKIYSEVGRLKKLQEENPNLKIAVAGCVAQAEGKEILERQPMIDIVVGPQSYHRLPAMVEQALLGVKSVDTEFPVEDKFNHLPQRRTAGVGISAYLTVQEGCDKFCTFCVVPYTRGGEVSRPAFEIIEEAEQLTSGRTREITLLGQNVNAYFARGTDGKMWKLARLITELGKIEGLKRIRFTTSHPRDMSEDLMRAFAECEKLMPYLHLPIQSGSDHILKAMNRRHTAAEYVELIQQIRSYRSDIVISGDFIVGFPGETEEDFQRTLDVIESVGYGKSYSFKYSARPGTPAADMEQVGPEIASERLGRLQDALAKHQQKIQRSMVGKTLPVLFERKGRERGQLVGRSEYMHSVHAVCPAELMGRIVAVDIMSSEANSLAGRLHSTDESIGGSGCNRTESLALL